MTKQVHIHIHRTRARDAGEGEGRWITLSPSGTHVKIDKGGEITAGPKGMTGKKPSELSSKPSAPARAQERTPMRQEMRNLQATGLKEARKLTRSPAQPGMERSINRLQAEADINEAKERVYARRSESRSKDPDTGFAVHKNTRFDPKAPPLKGSSGAATAKTESYSWGKLTKVGNVNESAIAHPKDREQIASLADGDSYQYTDEQGKQWKVTRRGEQAAFYKANAASPALVAPIGEFQDTPHDPTGMAHAGRPQGTAAVQARIDAKKAAASKPGPYYGAPLRGIGFSSPSEAQSPRKPENLPAPNPRKILESNKKSMEQLEKLVNNPGTLHSVKYDAKQTLANLRKQNEELERQIAAEMSKPVGFAGKASAPDLTKHSQFTKADYDYLKEKGWSDPEIKKRWDEEAAQGRPPQQANKLKPPSAFGPAAGEGPRGASRAGSAGPATAKTDWSKSNGDWATAKKEGAEMFERAMSSAKTGGDRTDAALKLKAEAAEKQKNGSYLGAVVLGLVNDYFDRLK